MKARVMVMIWMSSPMQAVPAIPFRLLHVVPPGNQQAGMRTRLILKAMVIWVKMKAF
jgi:hypothetical protein